MIESARLDDKRTLVRSLLQLEDAVLKRLAGLGVSSRRSSAGIRDHLLSLETVVLGRIESKLIAFLRALDMTETEGIDPFDDKKFLQLSMRQIGVSFPLDLLEKMTTEDLIEGYDGDRMQVFRNLRFMETSSYSLLEILSHDWPTLFNRSSAITDHLISYSDEILWANNRTIDLAVPTHYIQERRALDPQVLEIEFRHLAPLYTGPGRPFGFIATCRARVVETKAMRSELSFI